LLRLTPLSNRSRAGARSLYRLLVRWARSRHAGLLALAAGLSSLALRDAALLARYTVPAGVDGYYYVVQIEALRESGRLYYATHTPLVAYALAGISYAVGDAVVAVKLGAVALHTLLCVGLYSMLTSLTRDSWLGCLCALLAAASGLHLLLVSEYVNNLGALALLLCVCACLARSRQSHRPRVWEAAAALCFAGALLSHRSAWAIALVFVFSALLCRVMLTTASACGRRVALAAVLLVWSLPALVSAQPLFHLSDWLRWEITHLPRPSFFSVAAGEKLALLIAAPACLWACFRSRDAHAPGRARYLLGGVALMSLLLTLNPFLNGERGLSSLAGRLSYLAHIQAAVLTAGLVLQSRTLNRRGLSLVAALAALCVVSGSRQLPIGMRDEYLDVRSELVRQLSAKRGVLSRADVVVAAHGEEFTVTAILGVPAQQRPPRDEPRREFYWLIHRFDRTLLPEGIVVLSDAAEAFPTVLVKNDDLMRRLRTMSSAERLARAKTALEHEQEGGPVTHSGEGGEESRHLLVGERPRRPAGRQRQQSL
jgi:hypothetical protein